MPESEALQRARQRVSLMAWDSASAYALISIAASLETLCQHLGIGEENE